ncbi:hypothetical protein HS088_TW22G01428 [Tripterygium wilfordii]|uniref:Rad60/SUMO-like domain-containing protein n=1 Tax=Tripterygium wilfordii TaxID=458696 RepID=A0A7J7C0U0_TRIWF|nr:uncharacterized protein LOC119990376 [Tripterygium wilfordii]KAF5727731.1 hypothetical protein HS088_TW22G01428 [Tripterygium wilfordii]
MADVVDDLEPLFDYSRVQPVIVNLDDDSDSSPVRKRKKTCSSVAKEVEDEVKIIEVVNAKTKDEEDWLPPPPKFSAIAQSHLEDSTIKELRLKKQELQLFAKSAEDVLRAAMEAEKKECINSAKTSSEAVAEQPEKCHLNRAKIVVSIQDKQELKQFRIFMDDKFDRLFKRYAEKVKIDAQNLVFCFDGDKINPTATPEGLGMEDDDIIEVHVKKS